MPGLGLKRGLGDELVVAPYATALAVMIDPAAQRRATCAGWPRPASRATTASSTPIDYTHRGAGRRWRPGEPPPTASSSRPTSRITPGMTLVALANALLGDRMVERFHADPRVQATELLLQERVPRHVADHRAAAARRDARRRAGRRRCRCAATASPHTVFPHTQFLSNGNYVTVGHQRRRRRQLLARPAGDAVAARRRRAMPDSQFIYLRDVRSGVGVVGRPTSRRGASPTTTRSTFSRRPRRRSAAATTRSRRSSTSRCRPKTTSKSGGCTVRQPQRRASARSTSPATPRSCWRRRPTTSRIRRSASCSSRPSTWPTAPRCSAIGGRAIRAMPAPGRCTCSASRAGRRGRSNGRPIARGSSAAAATADDPLALDGRALSGTTGFVLDPIVSLRQRIRLPPGAIGAPLLRHRHGRRIARPPRRWRGSIATRAPPRAPSRWR